MGILDKILKRNNKENKTADKKEKMNQSADFRKTLIPEEGELSVEELDKVTACTPRENMIHNLPKEAPGQDEER